MIRFKFDENIESETRDRSHSDPLVAIDLASAATETALSVPLCLSSPGIVSPMTFKPSNYQENVSSVGRSRPLPPPAPGTETTNASTILNSPNLRGRRRKINDRRRNKDEEKETLRFSLSEPHLQASSHTRFTPAIRGALVSSKIEQKPSIAMQASSYSVENSDANKLLQPSANQSLSSNSSSNLSASFSASFSAKLGSIFGKAEEKSAIKDRGVASSKPGTNASDDISVDEMDETVLHIYLLNGESQMIPLLRTTRINLIIVSIF